MTKTAYVLLLLFGSVALATPPHGIVAAAVANDTHVLALGSVKRGHESPVAVMRWLRLQRVVRSVSLGRDGETIDLHFRDGLHAAILPKSQHSVALSSFGALNRPAIPTRAPAGAQAAVWEPFATELGLGSNAGDIEVQRLQAAGFAVDQKYDTSVTVSKLASLSNFNVVYMHTHSGVTAGGGGVVASGELANGDPNVLPYVQDGSVITVGVSGSSQQYYGITSQFISAHEGMFPANALVFLNGCALLRATTFWQALNVHGVATLISWDQNAQAKDDFLSAAALFNVMGSGQTVAGAIAILRNAGYGVSSDNGVPATLGFLGDGTNTLHAAAAGGNQVAMPSPATATSMPTETPLPVASPTPTVTSSPVPTLIPTVTSTLVPTHPPVPSLATLIGLVKPGARQHVSVQNLVPATEVQLRVAYPNGDIMQIQTQADSTGAARFSYAQPSSKLTRTSRTALVAITSTTTSGTATNTLKYTIGYGKIDLVANPRIVRSGGHGAIFVHTKAGQSVTVRFKPAGGKARTKQGNTGVHGWLKVRYSLSAFSHRSHKLLIRATVRLHNHTYRTSTTISVL